VACLPRVAATATILHDLEPNVPSKKPHVFCIAHAKIDVTDIRSAEGHDSKVVIRDKVTRRVTRHDAIETQPDLAKM